MANEIYDSTWWGNTIDTASSIGTSTEMIQGQFNLTKLGEEKIVNGDFATDSNWTKGTGWSISGALNAVATTSTAFQINTGIVSGKTYKVTYTISNYVSGSVRIELGSGNVSVGTIRSANGTYTEYIVALGDETIYFDGIVSFTGSIDNVSVKLVRATTVEASKCLADAIHRIGIQDIQN